MTNPDQSDREGVVTVRGAASSFSQTVHARSHEWRADEPIDHGGADTGPTPYELLLAALGT
jgi:putative redox protein